MSDRRWPFRLVFLLLKSLAFSNPFVLKEIFQVFPLIITSTPFFALTFNPLNKLGPYSFFRLLSASLIPAFRVQLEILSGLVHPLCEAWFHFFSLILTSRPLSSCFCALVIAYLILMQASCPITLDSSFPLSITYISLSVVIFLGFIRFSLLFSCKR